MFSKLVYLTTASLVYGQADFDFSAAIVDFDEGDFNFDDFNPDDFENFSEEDFKAMETGFDEEEFKTMTEDFTEEELAAMAEEFKEMDPELFDEFQADMEAWEKTGDAAWNETSWDADMLGMDESTWGPPIQASGAILSGDQCTFSYDCISSCCAMNIEIDTTSALGYAMYDISKIYTDAEVEMMEAGQERILADGIVSYVNYGIKQYFDSETDSVIPEYMLTYFPEFTETDGDNRLEYKYPVCQSNTTMCGSRQRSDWDADAAMGLTGTVSLLMLGLTSALI